MFESTESLLSPREAIRLLVRYRWRWILPAVIVGALAVVAARFKVDKWEASQGFVIRNEAIAGAEDPGKFRHGDEMKTVLETILELSRSSSVLTGALQQVGPPPGRPASTPWPLPEDVDQLADRMQLAPPKGAEFGKTEVFYLKVQDPDRSRAIALVQAIADQLEARYNQLRDDRAIGVVRELTGAETLAETDLIVITEKVRKLEASVGGDLAELRSLTQGGADSDLRRKTVEVENELRQAKQQERQQREVLYLLETAQSDPGRLLAAPQGLLEAQPALKRLKEGLVDAQLRTATLVGRMTDVHPSVQAARDSEDEVSRQLQAEIEVARRGVAIDQRLAAERVRSLEGQLAQVRERLERLAGLRAEYSNLLTELDQRSRLVDTARRELAAAEASKASAASTSLITRLDVPDAGTRPVGPAREIIAAAGVFGGVFIGIGLLILTLPPRTTNSGPSGRMNAEHGAPSSGRMSLTKALAKTAA